MLREQVHFGYPIISCDAYSTEFRLLPGAIWHQMRRVRLRGAHQACLASSHLSQCFTPKDYSLLWPKNPKHKHIV